MDENRESQKQRAERYKSLYKESQADRAQESRLHGVQKRKTERLIEHNEKLLAHIRSKADGAAPCFCAGRRIAHRLLQLFHPDKWRGRNQLTAEEVTKIVLDAYNSQLCPDSRATTSGSSNSDTA